MERKIGEIFECGEWYQCINTGNCSECAFTDKRCYDFSTKGVDIIGDCTGRTFKKLEKVGEPYMLEDKKFQKYRVFKTPYIYHKIDCSWQSFSDPYYISLEIKKDMEEKKLNLKPFDIQKAREGKPVCTRDGRKARIICFDLKGAEYPIVAAVETRNCLAESISAYDKNGKFDHDKENNNDLMILPEKKEGWVNLYPCDYMGQKRYSTKEEALKKALSDVIATVKIEWEE